VRLGEVRRAAAGLEMVECKAMVLAELREQKRV
jgi:hypothetical protein